MAEDVIIVCQSQRGAKSVPNGWDEQTRICAVTAMVGSRVIGGLVRCPCGVASLREASRSSVWTKNEHPAEIVTDQSELVSLPLLNAICLYVLRRPCLCGSDGPLCDGICRHDGRQFVFSMVSYAADAVFLLVDFRWIVAVIPMDAA